MGIHGTVEGVVGHTDKKPSIPFVWKLLTIGLILGAVGFVASDSNARPHALPLYAYGTSYLAGDTVNTPGRRYIDQLNRALHPSEFHNFGKDGATVEQVAATVQDTWRSQRRDRGDRCRDQQPVPDRATTRSKASRRQNPCTGRCSSGSDSFP